MAIGPLQRFRLARWVRQAQRGDAKAFSALFSTLHPIVYGYLAARVRVRADAEDLTADTLHRFVERIGRYDASKGGVRGWVLTIARNALIDHMRKAGRQDIAPLGEVEHLLADGRFAADGGALDPRLQQVRDALAEHPMTTREMFGLRYGEGLTVAEIAVVLDLTESAAKQRFSRALRAIKQRLENPTQEEETAHAHS